MNFNSMIKIAFGNTFRSFGTTIKQNWQSVLAGVAVFAFAFGIGFTTESSAQAGVKGAYKMTKGIYEDLKKDVKKLTADKDALMKNKKQIEGIVKDLIKTKDKTVKTVESVGKNLKKTLDDIITTGKHVAKIKDIPKQLLK